MIVGTRAECCYTSRVYFINKNPDVTCYFYSQAKTTRINPGDCKIPKVICVHSICGDGAAPGSGVYCGKGSCNLFGCNCDNGCRRGATTDPNTSFKERYGANVELLNDVCPSIAGRLG